jgi:Protein of unknown function (DUF1552)
MTKVLSRRMFLRGAGVALTVPWLDAMTPTFAATPALPGPRRRMVVVCHSLSLHAPSFFPKKPGPDYEPSPYLEVLKDFRRDLTVFSGLSHPDCMQGHEAERLFLTGCRGEPGGRITISLDQLVAEKIGAQTRLPYLCLSARGLSRSRNGAQIPRMGSPSKIFARLFLEGSPRETELLRERLCEGQSIMDVVRDQARQLEGKVGHDDRRRLDEYFDSVRELEQGLVSAAEWAKKPKPKVDVPPPQDTPGNGSTTLRLYYDLMYLAFRTDSTRVATMDFTHSGVPPLEGVHYDHHTLSHGWSDPDKVKEVRIVDEDAMKALRDFLSKLKQTNEEGETLLERTMVLAGSQMGDSSAHTCTNLPILLAGGGFKHGQHLAFDRRNNTALCNLYVMMLRRFGLEVDSFGSSTGTIPGLEIKG